MSHPGAQDVHILTVQALQGTPFLGIWSTRAPPLLCGRPLCARLSRLLPGRGASLQLPTRDLTAHRAAAWADSSGTGISASGTAAPVGPVPPDEAGVPRATSPFLTQPITHTTPTAGAGSLGPRREDRDTASCWTVTRRRPCTTSQMSRQSVTTAHYIASWRTLLGVSSFYLVGCR